MLRAGVIVAIALLALAGCQRPAPPTDITGLLRAQGFDFLDTPEVTISPICSVDVGRTRYDLFWYEWHQRSEDAPGAALHAAHRLIQIRDGLTYDGHYGSLQPEDRPTCRPDHRELVFSASPDDVRNYGLPPHTAITVGKDGLPRQILVNGQVYLRDR